MVASSHCYCYSMKPPRMPLKLAYLLLLICNFAVASPIQASPSKTVACSFCDGKFAKTKYPKPTVYVQCDVSNITCKCFSRRCTQDPKVILTHCGTSRYYANVNVMVKLGKICANMKCQRMQAVRIENNRMRSYPLSYRGLIYPAQYKTAKGKTVAINTTMSAKKFCYLIDGKGSYVLVPSAIKGTKKKEARRTRVATKKKNDKLRAAARQTRKKVGTTPNRQSNRKSKTPWKKMKAGTSRKIASKISTKQLRKLKGISTAGIGKRGRKMTPRFVLKSTKPIWSRATKSTKRAARKRPGTRKLRYATTSTKRRTKRTSRSTRRSKRTRSQKHRGAAPRSSRRTTRIRKRTNKTTRGRGRSNRTTGSSKKRRTTVRNGRSTRTKSSSKPKNQTTKRSGRRLTTRWNNTAAKPKKRSRCKGNGTRKCDEPMHEATGFVSSGCIPETELIDVMLSCSTCTQHNYPTLTTFGKLERRMQCEKFHIICECPGWQCEHQTNHIVPFCNLSHVPQMNLTEYGTICTGRRCTHFQARTDPSKPIEHILIYYKGRVLPGYADSEPPSWDKVHWGESNLNEYCGNRSKGFERRQKPKICEGQPHLVGIGCKVPDRLNVKAHLSCSGCRDRSGQFLSMRDNTFECTIPQDACKCQEESCRVANKNEYMYLAYCKGQDSNTLDIFLKQCHKAGCQGAQAETIDRDYFLFHDGQKLRQGNMRYRGRNTMNIDKNYTIAEFCSQGLRPAGYKLVERPFECGTPVPPSRPNSKLVFCAGCDGIDTKSLELDRAHNVPCKQKHTLCPPCTDRVCVSLNSCELDSSPHWEYIVNDLVERCKSIQCKYVQVNATDGHWHVLNHWGTLYPGLMYVRDNMTVVIEQKVTNISLCDRIKTNTSGQTIDRLLCESFDNLYEVRFQSGWPCLHSANAMSASQPENVGQP